MSPSDLLSTIRASRLQSLSLCDLACLCALGAGPSASVANLSHRTGYNYATCGEALSSLAAARLVRIHHRPVPQPTGSRITPLGRHTLDSILAGLCRRNSPQPA